MFGLNPALRGVQDLIRMLKSEWVKTLSGQEISKRISGVGNVMSLNPVFTP